MSFTDVVPKEWVQKWGKDFVRHPLGTGPYMLDHWTPAQEIVLMRNPNWTDWRGVRPGVGRRHQGAALGQPVDGAAQAQDAARTTSSATTSRPSDYVAVTHDPMWKSQVAEEPAIAIDYLFMNVQMKPFDNLKVRQAVSWAIDRSKLLKLISGRRQRALTQIYPAGLPGHVDGAAGQFYGYDPAKAKQLLAAAGYPNGFSDDDLLAQRRPVAQGRAVDPERPHADRHQGQRQVPRPRHLLDAHRRARARCAMGLQDWWQDFPDPSDFVVPLFSKSNAVAGGANPSFWWNPQVETLLAAELRHDRPDAAPAARSTRCSRIIMARRRRCRSTSPT